MRTETTFHPESRPFKSGVCRFLKFGAASLASAALDLTAFTLLLRAFPETAGGIFATTAIARVLSGICNFSINRGWVFRQSGNTKRQVLSYTLLFFAQMLASAQLVWALSALSVSTTVVKAGVDAALFLISYQIQNRWIFRNTAGKKGGTVFIILQRLAKPWRWAGIYAILLTAAFTLALLDAFVIPKAQIAVVEPPAASDIQMESPSQAETPSQTDQIGSESAFLGEEISAALPMEPVITATSYEDENIRIQIETVREHDTTYYVADVQVSDAAYLRTALAQNTFGRNIKDTTSEMASAHNAIFAVNGDYYGFRDKGYVLRNGILYRETVSDSDALLIDYHGNLSVIDQASATGDILQNAWQIFSFGPALVENGAVVVDESSEVSKSKSSNPRTAIGQISELHYIFIVSDGRTGESAGLSLLQLAQVFKERGAVLAYNLDGGGSSTMYFNGEVVNNPTNGRSEKEREVSDIVYIGYE